jgi:hypothetical protein
VATEAYNARLDRLDDGGLVCELASAAADYVSDHALPPVNGRFDCVWFAARERGLLNLLRWDIWASVRARQLGRVTASA